MKITPAGGGDYAKMTIKQTYDPNFDDYENPAENFIKFRDWYVKTFEYLNGEEVRSIFYNAKEGICYYFSIKNKYYGLLMNIDSFIKDVKVLGEMRSNIMQLDASQRIPALLGLKLYENVLVKTYFISSALGFVEGLDLYVGVCWAELLSLLRYVGCLSDEPGYIARIIWRLDPSGYVYEGVTSNRLEGVKTTVYYKDSESGDAVLWNAEEYDQKNPLYTNADGRYSWMVPEGLWQVKYELDGYETTYSDWLPVPPPQMDVNIGLTSKKAPEIISQEASGDEIKLIFSQYMKPDTVENIKLYTKDKEELDYTLSYPEDETDLDSNVLAKAYILKIENMPEETSSCILSISEDVKSYADVGVNSGDYTLTFEDEFMSISLPEAKELAVNEAARIKITTHGFDENDTISAVSNVESVVSVEDITGADGIFYLTLKANDIGSANITLTLPNSEEKVLETNVLPTSENRVSFNGITSNDETFDVALSNNTDDELGGVCVVAKYDKDGRLIAVKLKDFELSDTESVSLDNPKPDSEHYSIFILNSLSGMTPLTENY